MARKKKEKKNGLGIGVKLSEMDAEAFEAHKKRIEARMLRHGADKKYIEDKLMAIEQRYARVKAEPRVAK